MKIFLNLDNFSPSNSIMPKETLPLMSGQAPVLRRFEVSKVRGNFSTSKT